MKDTRDWLTETASSVISHQVFFVVLCSDSGIICWLNLMQCNILSVVFFLIAFFIFEFGTKFVS